MKNILPDNHTFDQYILKDNHGLNKVMDTKISLEYLLNNSILTGSRRFNVHKDTSDYDLIVTDDFLFHVLENIKDSDILDGDDSGNGKIKNHFSVLFKLDNITINLISYRNDNEIQLMEKVNLKMLKLNKNILSSKKRRCTYFEKYTSEILNNTVLGVPDISITEEELMDSWLRQLVYNDN